MFRIRTVSEEDAQGKVKAVYDEMKSSMGMVPNVIKVLSLYPDALEGYANLLKTIMFSDTRLVRAVKEMIAARVSFLNSCDYCLGHHQNFMTMFGIDVSAAEQVAKDPQTAPISDAEKRLLGFIEKVTRKAYKTTDQDVQELRDVGWSDEQILEATLVCSLFNDINRFADALGVEPENR